MNLINKILNDTQLTIEQSIRFLTESIEYIGIVLPTLNLNEYLYLKETNQNLIHWNNVEINVEDNSQFKIWDEILILLNWTYEFSKVKTKVSTDKITLDLTNDYNWITLIFWIVNDYNLNKGIYLYILEENFKLKDIKTSWKDSISYSQWTVSYSENWTRIKYIPDEYFSKIEWFVFKETDSDIWTIDLIKT